jgi:hypothetical protein
MTETESAYLKRRAETEADWARRVECLAVVPADCQLSGAYFKSAEALKQFARSAAR